MLNGCGSAACMFHVGRKKVQAVMNAAPAGETSTPLAYPKRSVSWGQDVAVWYQFDNPSGGGVESVACIGKVVAVRMSQRLIDGPVSLDNRLPARWANQPWMSVRVSPSASGSVCAVLVQCLRTCTATHQCHRCVCVPLSPLIPQLIYVASSCRLP